MVVHTGIIFETAAAMRVVIKVNDVPFKYVQLQHFPMEHLTIPWIYKLLCEISKKENCCNKHTLTMFPKIPFMC